MTIEDIIRKFIFSLQMQRRTGFLGSDLYKHVCHEMRIFNGKHVEEESVLRKLRDMKQRLGNVDYECVNKVTGEYILYPKRGIYE